MTAAPESEEGRPERTELDALDPATMVVKLSTGFELEVLRLKARQFFRMLRIITHGGAGMLQHLRVSQAMEEPEEFAAQLIAIIMFSIPDAEQEALDFVRSMVRDPSDEVVRVEEVAGRKVRVKRVDEELENPEIDDLVTIIEAIVDQEKEDLAALGKRLGKLMKVAEKTGQLEETPGSSGGSAEPSTSSAASTDGRTASSGNSASDASDKSSTPSQSDEEEKTSANAR